jgi:hypothetical protein
MAGLLRVVAPRGKRDPIGAGPTALFAGHAETPTRRHARLHTWLDTR